MRELNTWINQPKHYRIDQGQLTFDVLPKTDFWQVTHYGFSRTDGNCLVAAIDHDICFTTKVKMQYIANFDQAGIIVYIDDKNFAKLCVEYQVTGKDKLGSVVCKDARSDWATQSMETREEIFLRVSKRENNFLFEYSINGISYEQLRLFDMTSSKTYIGVFGASPLGQGFEAVFTNTAFSKNQWYLDTDDLPDDYK